MIWIIYALAGWGALTLALVVFLLAWERYDAWRKDLLSVVNLRIDDIQDHVNRLEINTRRKK